MLKRFGIDSRVETVSDTADTAPVVKNIVFPLVTAITVPQDNECAVITIDIQNGETPANVIIRVYRNSSVLSTLLYHLEAWENMIIDSKEFLEEGDVLKVGADVEGVNFGISCDISPILDELAPEEQA